jgi:hypothetical protein
MVFNSFAHEHNVSSLYNVQFYSSHSITRNLGIFYAI